MCAMYQTLGNFFYKEGHELVEWAKCGDSVVTVIPTVLWAVGAAALAHRLINSIFRRFIFRRVPLWELVLQNLLFIWMVIYSIHSWVFLVKIIKVFIDYCYEDAFSEPYLAPLEDLESQKMVQQCLIWVCGAVPIAVYVHNRPRPESPQMMIWITTNPWQRREMGPYGYYLNRPLSQTPGAVAAQHTPLRRAFSDSSILIKEPPKRRRYSKSI